MTHCSIDRLDEFLPCSARCSLCSKKQSMQAHMWAVCPACRHWFCASHTGSMPLRNCDVCGRVNYKDFVGGSDSLHGTALRSASFANITRRQRPSTNRQASLHMGEGEENLPGDVEDFNCEGVLAVNTSRRADDTVSRLGDAGSDSDGNTRFWGPSEFSPLEGRRSDPVRSSLQTPDYSGGSVPPEILARLPSFFFSIDYLQSLATCSRAMLAAAQDTGNWRGVDLHLVVSEFRSKAALRKAAQLWTEARTLSFDLVQLSSLQDYPNTSRLFWRPQAILMSDNVVGYVSEHPLLGAARFQLMLPSTTTCLYLGVKDLDSSRRIYCKLHNVFSSSGLSLSVGISDEGPAQVRRGSTLSPLRRDGGSNDFVLRWSHRYFAVEINGQHGVLARLQDDIEDAPGALSRIFVWVLSANAANSALVALPSPILRTAYIKCPICERETSLQLPRWRVCPLCYSWICAHHISPRTAERRCPRCVLQLSDYVGGAGAIEISHAPGRVCSMPEEILKALPGHFFPYKYLGTLAAVSRTLLAGVRDRSLWRNKNIFLDNTEFLDAALLRRMADLWDGSRSINVTLVQLSMLLWFPDNLRLMWSAEATPPMVMGTQGFYGLVSRQPLLGCAHFDLVVPSTVTGLYIGVKDWSSTKTSYVRVDNVFGAGMIWSISLGGSDPVPQQLRNPHVLLAEQPNRVLLSWQQDRFELIMNGHRLNARSSGPGPAAAPPLSRLFIWSFTRGHQAGETQQKLMSVTPQPSPVMLNAQIRCAVCHGEKSLLFPQWCICPRCSTWSCARHVGEMPWRQCPRCPALLADYVGGSVKAEQRTMFRGMSPLCCPTRHRACRVRVPLPNEEHEHSLSCKLVVVADAPVDSDLLRGSNPNSRDSCVQFFSDVHTYYARGINAEKVIQAMMTGSRFPRPEYCNCDEQPDDGATARDVRGGSSQDSFGLPAVGNALDEDTEAMDQRPEVPVAAPAGLHDEAAQGPGEEQQSLAIELSQPALVDEDVADGLLGQARRRRLKEGADTSMPAFKQSFQELRTIAKRSLQALVPLQSPTQLTIPEHVHRLRAEVIEKFPDMGEDLLRICVGALAVYRLRLTDVHVRELVMLLWIVEGDTHMRCHGGNLYFFHHGAFTLHRGIPPEGTLARCKKYCLRLEGLFRLLDNDPMRNDREVLSAIETLLANHNGSAIDLLNVCEDTAQGSFPKRGQRGRSAAEQAGEEVGAADHGGRGARTADALSKAGWTLQSKLIDDKIFNLVVEWCDSPQTRAAGVSYLDCAVLYDRGHGGRVTSVEGCPSHNIYLHIPHALRASLPDPVLQQACERLDQFYMETFWLNNDAASLWKGCARNNKHDNLV